MKRFQKPSGVILEVNPNSYAHCIAMGWVEVVDTDDNVTGEKKDVIDYFKKPRGRPRKEA